MTCAPYFFYFFLIVYFFSGGKHDVNGSRNLSNFIFPLLRRLYAWTTMSVHSVLRGGGFLLHLRLGLVRVQALFSHSQRRALAEPLLVVLLTRLQH